MESSIVSKCTGSSEFAYADTIKENGFAISLTVWPGKIRQGSKIIEIAKSDMTHTHKIDFFKRWSLVSYRNARGVVNSHTLIPLKKTVLRYLLPFGQEKSDKVQNRYNDDVNLTLPIRTSIFTDVFWS